MRLGAPRTLNPQHIPGAVAWACRARPAAYRRRRREYLAACKLSLLLATAVVAATQTSLLPNPARYHWHVVMFALMYGRGLFLGMATLFVQVGAPWGALGAV